MNTAVLIWFCKVVLFYSMCKCVYIASVLYLTWIVQALRFIKLFIGNLLGCRSMHNALVNSPSNTESAQHVHKSILL